MPTPGELRLHREWLGLLQPVGLVVSPPALAAAQAVPDRNVVEPQQALRALIEGDDTGGEARDAALRDFPAFAREVLGWRANRLAGAEGGPELPQALQAVLPELDETLRPTYAVPALREDTGDWMLLVQELPLGTELDRAPDDDGRHWHASPQARFERLLRETGVDVGILCNGRELRLVYAPRGESTGHMTWPVYALAEVSGRPLLSALVMLLGNASLFTRPRDQRLPHILRESRKYQNVVSAQLAGQVLEALNELLRGFQAANEVAGGRLLNEIADEDPDHVYGGLLAVILRLVFVLYAEERGLMSSAEVYVRNYALASLFEKLRADQGRFPDTMDQRYGAWARLLVLFRLIYDGASAGDLHLPPRHGHLFDPESWPFLEGRARGSDRMKVGRLDVPRVPDGTIYRVLDKLLLLDGDRLSYLALDVEQIGSVYQGMIGFRVERAKETSIGIGKQHVVVGLDTVLAKSGAERNRSLKESAGVELSGRALEELHKAKTVDEVTAALQRRISPLTPQPIPPGRLYLQPTDERRRSGSHYTPRELTEPIVRTTLRPVLERLGARPTPAQILALKVCDIAMGSGAFLVETCRQLAEVLVTAYEVHGRPVEVPPDEDILLYARRQVAQHCLYGLDRNPFAVDLAKLSLWLATLAKDHPFTFIDHALRCGDSLVGLSRRQIEGSSWAQNPQTLLFAQEVAPRVAAALEQRQALLSLGDEATSPEQKQKRLEAADLRLHLVRFIGDATIAAFFGADKDKAREEKRVDLATRINRYLATGQVGQRPTGEVERLLSGKFRVTPFHWEIEFPEIFHRENPGFDAIVGNPPFLGGKRISGQFGGSYLDWLLITHFGAEGGADLVAHFFRRAFSLLRINGTGGLVATNTISQGDTRGAALRFICGNGGTIVAAERRHKWPGEAAVTVSVVWFMRGTVGGERMLDGHRG